MLAKAEQEFSEVCTQAQELKLAENAGAAFRAVGVVTSLRQILTDDIMRAVFMPLANTSIGFLTDQDPNKNNKRTGLPNTPYSVGVVRDCLIDAVMKGLLPTGNQFNIIAGRQYTTNEGYSYLLKKLNVRHMISKAILPAPPNAPFVDVKCTIAYFVNGEAGKTFSITVSASRTSIRLRTRSRARQTARPRRLSRSSSQARTYETEMSCRLMTTFRLTTSSRRQLRSSRRDKKCAPARRHLTNSCS